MKTALFGVATALAVILTLNLSCAAEELSVFASNAVKEACIELVPRYEKVSGHKVKTIWGGTVDITRRIADGEVFDIVILPASSIDQLIRQGRLASGNRVDFVRSGIGVAIRPGAPRPDISSGESLKTALLKAKSIVLSAGPSGGYLSGLFKRMGIADTIKTKTKQLMPGQSVGEALAHGEGDIGFTQVSEFLAVKGIDYIGPLPADIQQITVFSMGLHTHAPSADAAKALINFLTAPDAVPAIRRSGMEPG
jgi:molybdate transport system substrate-binding protein